MLSSASAWISWSISARVFCSVNARSSVPFEAGIVVQERNPRRDAVPTSRWRSSGRPGAASDEELVVEGFWRQQCVPGQIGDAPGGVDGLRVRLPRDFSQTAGAHEGQIGGDTDREQGLARADVGGRLLAANVLLAGLQREDEPTSAFVIGCLTRDSAWQLPDVFGLAGHEPCPRPAVLQRQPQRTWLLARCRRPMRQVI